MVFYTDAQVFESRKESYIAVLDDTEGVIFFGSVGYKSVQDAEGLAILQALRHIDFYERKDAVIYTDNLSWSDVINGHHRIAGLKEKHVKTRRILQAILQLKEKWNVTIEWRRRNQNKAGIFLAHVWQLKASERDRYYMRFTDLPNGEDIEELMDKKTPTFEERRKFFDRFHQELASRHRIPLPTVMFIRSAVIGHRRSKEQIVVDCENFVSKKEEALKQLDIALERYKDNFARFTTINEQKEGILKKVHERQGIAQIIKICPDEVWNELIVKTEFDKP